MPTLTAWQAIVDTAKAGPGMRFLIHGASGGVGSFAAQFAHWKGAQVAATASKPSFDYLRSIGGETQARSWGVLKRGGMLITLVGEIDEEAARRAGVRAVDFGMEYDVDDLKEIAGLVERRIVEPHISRVLPLDRAREALDQCCSEIRSAPRRASRRPDLDRLVRAGSRTDPLLRLGSQDEEGDLPPFAPAEARGAGAGGDEAGLVPGPRRAHHPRLPHAAGRRYPPSACPWCSSPTAGPGRATSGVAARLRSGSPPADTRCCSPTSAARPGTARSSSTPATGSGARPCTPFTLLRTIPPYWKTAWSLFRTRIGDIDDPKDEALLRAAFPLFSAERIRIPLLIGQGANDPRVKQAESEQIVAAIEKNGGKVTYVVYPDEGHGFARPENRMDFNARAERFLAGELGGRAEPMEGERLPGSTAVVRVIGGSAAGAAAIGR